MAKKPAKLRPDVAEMTFRVMQEAVGERPKTPPPSERTEKNPDAVKRGRKGDKKSGTARAKSLSASQRKRAARRAAKTRWEDHQQEDGK